MCESEYLMLYQAFHKHKDGDGNVSDEERDAEIVRKMQEWTENNRNCFCLDAYDMCMKMVFPSKEAGGYYYGTVRLHGQVNSCTPWKIELGNKICSAYPPEPPEYWRWCIGAVHGQGEMDEGHLRLYDR